MTRRQARFITFEGGDGAGKTTLIDKIHTYLEDQGYTVVRTRAPGGSQVGAEIRKLLLAKHPLALSTRCELFLFLADRAQHVDEIIRPALDKQQIVLCDRFNDSTLAYQGYARGFDKKWIETLLRFASDKITPDLTLFLDLDPKIGFERAKKGRTGPDRIESEALAFHRKIRQAFRQIAKAHPKRFLTINAELSPETVFEQAKEKIDALLKNTRKSGG
jgi:dTMP kinase